MTELEKLKEEVPDAVIKAKMDVVDSLLDRAFKLGQESVTEKLRKEIEDCDIPEECLVCETRRKALLSTASKD